MALANINEKSTAANDTARAKYVVGFTVHEAKELSKDGVDIDPQVVVRCLDKEYTTDLKKGKLEHVKFDESSIWSDVWLTPEEFNMAFIDFTLEAASIFFRNEVVGSARVQLSLVRRRPNHIYVGKWMQLSNGASIGAKLKVTVFCYGKGDDPPKPEDMGHDAEETEEHLADLGAAVMQAGQGERANQFQQCYHLFVQVHRAEYLGGGKEHYNPYASVEFNGLKLQTPHVSKTHTVSFDEAFRIPVMTPLFADSILVRIWHKKKGWTQDDVIAQGRLSFSGLRMHALQPKWFNFYGLDEKEVNDVNALTSAGEIVEENFYKGRLLISGRVQKVKGQDGLLRPGLTQGGAYEDPPSMSIWLLADVFEISGCSGEKVYVQMMLGTKSKKTKTIGRDCEVQEDETIETGKRFKFKGDEGRMDPLVAVMPIDTTNQLDLIISVWASGLAGFLEATTFRRVGFTRIKISSLKDWQGEATAPIWVPLSPMAHLPSSVNSGTMLLSLQKSFKPIGERAKPNVKPLEFEIRAYVCSARGLKSANTAVPTTKCEISCASSKMLTEAVEYTSAPRYATVLKLNVELQCSLQSLRVFPEPVQVTVFECTDEVQASAQEAAAVAAVEQAKQATMEKLGAGGPGAGGPGAGGPGDKVAEAKAAMGAQANEVGAKAGDKAMGAAAKALNTDTDALKKTAGAVAVGLHAITQGDQAAMQGAQDRFQAAVGCDLAKKRLGAVVNGRRIIGRAQVRLESLMRPPVNKAPLKPQWIRLRGGMMGTAHAGDILVGFEMMKKKYAKQLPVKPVRPPQKKCTMSICLIGLRDVLTPSSGEMKAPKVEVIVPNFSQVHSRQAIQYTKKPNKGAGMSDDDFNRRWTIEGRSGYDILKVMHMDVELPQFPVWEPDVRFILLNDQDLRVAEGRLSVAQYLPWVKPDTALSMISSQDQYEDSDAGDSDCGIPVSDAENDGNKNYITVEVGFETLRIQFNAADNKSFPPVVQSLAPNSKAKQEGVKPGDWLIAYKSPGDKFEKATGHWNSAQAAGFVKEYDGNKARPLMLRFRRKDKTEVAVRLIPKGDSGLEFVKGSERPPKIKADNTGQKMWRKQGVANGWRVVDINGFDCTKMTAEDDKFQKLIASRPIIVTCRAHGIVAENKSAEKKMQGTKPVMLNGVPAKVTKVHEHKLKNKDGPLKCTLVPRPSAIIPKNTDTHRLNLRTARSAILDVRGLIKLIVSQGEEADERARPSVPAKLEDYIEAAYWHTIPLYSGDTESGEVKCALKINPGVDQKWMDKIKDPENLDGIFFNEKRLREKFKVDTPLSLRVRTYIVRGLNVSGAVMGHGNPYLFFKYGQHQVRLEGYKQMSTVEPRFFRTEERDIKLPDQARFELGLIDSQGQGNNDPEIGRTVIDLEDRWHSATFQEYMRKNQVPVEYRPVMNEKEHLSKGSLEMWVELLDASMAGEIKKSQLVQPPPVELEIRVIVWSVKDLSLRMCVDEETHEERTAIDFSVRCAIDCKTFMGSKNNQEQETDQHRGCEGEGEFNWRFVFSRIGVTRGMELDCFIGLTCWENFTFARPMMLCENLVQMKNYCRKVADSKEFLQMEAELPMTNRKLNNLLLQEKEENERMGVGEGGDDDDEEDSSDDEGGMADGPVPDGEESKGVPPAAMIKVMIQVLPQAEANNEKVGLGRKEPNRNPVMTFPSTGRSWQYALPSAAAAVEAVISAANTGKRRTKCAMIFFMFILLIIALHYFKNPQTGCPYIQDSCKASSACEACNCCFHEDEPDPIFCFYKGLTTAEQFCTGGAVSDSCNIHLGTCDLLQPGFACSLQVGMCSNVRRNAQGAAMAVPAR